MTSDSSVFTLGDLMQRIIDHRGRTPKKLGGDFVNTGVPVISAKNIKGSRLVLDGDTRYVSHEMWERWMPTKLAAGDVLLTSEAPLGEAAYLADGGDYCLGQRLFALRPDRTMLDNRFLFYALQGPELRNEILARASGTTAQGIRQAELVKVSLRLPSLDEQKRIAWVLGSLDDTIANNRRLTKTLEAIAATLFKARFVDFVDHDDLVDSELGPIPRGWQIGTLSDIATVHRDFIKGDSDLPYIGLDAMPRGSTVITKWMGATDAPKGQAARFRTGDILFGKLRPYFKKVGVAPIDGRCSTEILVVRPLDAACFGVVLGHLSSQRFIDHCAAVSRGTKMPRAEWKDAGTFELAVPPRAAAAEFTEAVTAIHARIRSLIHESHTLVDLRDALLPRLVRGEVHVSSPDAMTAEVG